MRTVRGLWRVYVASLNVRRGTDNVDKWTVRTKFDRVLFSLFIKGETVFTGPPGGGRLFELQRPTANRTPPRNDIVKNRFDVPTEFPNSGERVTLKRNFGTDGTIRVPVAFDRQVRAWVNFGRESSTRYRGIARGSNTGVHHVGRTPTRPSLWGKRVRTKIPKYYTGDPGCFPKYSKRYR